MFYCRLVARPETIRNVGLLSFDILENQSLYERLSQHARPKYGVPYVFPISSIQRGDTPTRELFITKHLPAVMNQVAAEILAWDRESVYTGVLKILPIF